MRIGRNSEDRVAFARIPALLLVLLSLLVLEPARSHLIVCAFGLLYLFLALRHETAPWPLPAWIFPAMDALLLVVLLLEPGATLAFWLFFLFVLFGAGTRLRVQMSLGLALLWAAALALREAATGPGGKAGLVRAVALGVSAATAGVMMAWIGRLDRSEADRAGFLDFASDLLQYETGVSETLRRLLGAVKQNLNCESAYIMVADAEVERLFFWRVSGEAPEIVESDSVGVDRAEEFLMDDPAGAYCWNELSQEGAGFGWKNGERLSKIPAPSKPPAAELKARSMMTVPVVLPGETSARAFLLSGRQSYSPEDLRWMEIIFRRLASPLGNLFLLRHLRAQVVEAERSRLAGDLHDGLLQSLLSLDIQLDVLRHRYESKDEPLCKELEGLQKVVQSEGAELRRLVTDLRPVRIESADLPDMMQGFAERFRQETCIQVDLFIDEDDLRMPNRVCREVFQIYREALQNVKKHAKANHVVVKLERDGSRAQLMIDDNGEGFSFAGRFSSDELDELRLGPISIKERARHLGATLTLESSPGRGSRLTVGIPLC